MMDLADASPFSLCTPMATYHAAFAFGNAVLGLPMVAEGSAAGQSLVLCGAGPSLTDHAGQYDGDQVWGTNSAATWLSAQGHPVTHGFAIDSSVGMLEEWPEALLIDYLVASTVDPRLTTRLLAANRSVSLFHSRSGFEHEDWFYSTFFSRGLIAGSGLNAVTRAIDVAEWMGFTRITVLGADCALRDGLLHADGGGITAHGATATTRTGEIDGRRWTTKPDLLVTAVHLVRMQRRLGDRLTLVGDTLPNALASKDDAYLDRLTSLMHTP